MYRKAVTNKTAGGIIAINLTIAMIVATAWLARFETATLFITVVCVIFLICIAFSMHGYCMRLAEMQEQFSDDLETSVDRCTEQAAGKYFFFSDCLVDLANARIYYYDEIAYVSGMLALHSHFPGKLQQNRKSGASVTIRMKDGKQYMLGSFQGGMTQNRKEIKDGYLTFCELMHKYWNDPANQD